MLPWMLRLVNHAVTPSLPDSSTSSAPSLPTSASTSLYSAPPADPASATPACAALLAALIAGADSASTLSDRTPTVQVRAGAPAHATTSPRRRTPLRATARAAAASVVPAALTIERAHAHTH